MIAATWRNFRDEGDGQRRLRVSPTTERRHPSRAPGRKYWCSESLWKMYERLPAGAAAGAGYENAKSLYERGRAPDSSRDGLRDARINRIFEARRR